MKHILGLLVVAVLLGLGFYALYHGSSQEDAVVVSEETVTVEASAPTITPISHATMVLQWGETIIYTDPVGGAEAFAGQKPATLVLVTDIHGDHLSTSTLSAVVGEGTTLIAPQAVKDLLPEALAARVIVLANDATITEQGLTITGIPMYNVPETDDSRHPKGRGNGYLVEKEGYRVYIAGDTANTPSMRALTDIDMAFIPMNLPYTMSVEEAAEAVLAFAPRTVYPYHFRQPDGFADVQTFKTLVNEKNPTIEVILLDWYAGN
jgi:L-ascorbate metabolism protein UlaG (beta-lactamase superfamily)